MSQSASVQATSDHIAPEVSAELRALAIQRSVEQLSKSYCPYSKYRVRFHTPPASSRAQDLG